ncbi:MAG: GAF domain-containing protein [Rhodospirillaceae bacterium]|nr:GAF domain-containing protein [Rhodospirillaceae bacterium]
MSFEAHRITAASKPEFYRQLCDQLRGLLAGEHDRIANAANCAALLFQHMPDINWAGFYFLRENDELVLGPFQGKPACVRIAKGKGVCGAAVERRATVLVEDVHAFPGHIACDAASRSELVVPLIEQGRVTGVLDIDSPIPGRFDADDQAGLEQIAAIFGAP